MQNVEMRNVASATAPLIVELAEDRLKRIVNFAIEARQIPEKSRWDMRRESTSNLKTARRRQNAYDDHHGDGEEQYRK